MQTLPPTHQFTVEPSDAGKRLDHLLTDRLPQYSRARLQDWIDEGLVLVNERPAKRSLKIRGGESVTVSPAELPPLHAEPEAIPLSVLYEDAAVIAVDKPAGMVVHSGAGHHQGTLVNALLHRFGTLSMAGGEERPGIVHRLDRYTSGVLLVARTDTAHRALAAQFSGRKVRKIYLAMVHGKVAADGSVDTPIERDASRRIRMTTRTGRGRTAFTEYRVRERLDGYTFLEVQIHTGRTHQIRVHMSSIGHPVVGDSIYGAPAKPAGVPPLDRFFLHAWRIAFRSPATGDEVEIEAPLPAELEDWKRAAATRVR